MLMILYWYITDIEVDFMGTFIEQLVKKTRTKKDRLISVLIIAAAVTFIASMVLLGLTILPYLVFVAFFALMAFPFICHWLITSMNLEFEYSVMENVFTVDKIISKRKRKKVISIDIKKLERIIKLSETDLKGEQFYKCLYCGITEDGDDAFGAVFSDESTGRTMLVFSPDKKTLSAMRPFLKREIVRELFK